MENRFLGLIENSIKEHWDLPAFSDYNGHTYHYKDVARRIEKFHIILEHAGIKKGDKVALVGRNSSNWAICFFGHTGVWCGCRPHPPRVQAGQYPSYRKPFGGKGRTGRSQQLGEYERADDARCQTVHDAGQFLHHQEQE